MNESGMLNICV